MISYNKTTTKRREKKIARRNETEIRKKFTAWTCTQNFSYLLKRFIQSEYFHFIFGGVRLAKKRPFTFIADSKERVCERNGTLNGITIIGSLYVHDEYAK